MTREWILQFEQWWQQARPLQQWAVAISVAAIICVLAALVTRGPSERPRPSKIILNCKDGCGVDNERVMTYNEYQDQREQQARAWFTGEKQRIQQQVWNDRGRARWCRNHPHDYNCKEIK